MWLRLSVFTNQNILRLQVKQFILSTDQKVELVRTVSRKTSETQALHVTSLTELSVKGALGARIYLDSIRRIMCTNEHLTHMLILYLYFIGVLLTILIERFLKTHQLAIARLCDSIACRRVEMLLAGGLHDSASQLSAEELDKLEDFMNANKLSQRYLTPKYAKKN